MPDVRAAENKASESTMGLWVSEGQFASVITKKLAGSGAASSPPRGLSRISGLKESDAEIPTHLSSTDMEMRGKLLLRRASWMKYKPGSRGIEGYKRWAHFHTSHHSQVQETIETPITAVDSRTRVLELSTVFGPYSREYLVPKRTTVPVSVPASPDSSH
ncbi:hypothetical protein BDW67DRAFT_8504 [Aspergillus spinulosporus]